MDCPHCGSAVFKAASDGRKLKARTKILVLHKSGEVEINCSRCGRGVLVPLQASDGPMELQKADMPRFVVGKG